MENVVIKRGSRGEAVKKLQYYLHLQTDGVFGANTEEAVKQYQRSVGLTADGIVGKKTWEKLQLTNRFDVSARSINEIIVHCTATQEGKDYTANDIRKWHQSQGWSDIGYHYIVRLDGTIENGRNVNIAGAHCTGHNTHSIGVVYVGGVSADGKTPKDTRTDAQRVALKMLLIELKRLYPQAKIHGHRDFANKACPSFDATNEYKNL